MAANWNYAAHTAEENAAHDIRKEVWKKFYKVYIKLASVFASIRYEEEGVTKSVSQKIIDGAIKYNGNQPIPEFDSFAYIIKAKRTNERSTDGERMNYEISCEMIDSATMPISVAWLLQNEGNNDAFAQLIAYAKTVK
jgi:hypothetical protein